MAKNLYNLTAVTTVNDSDLLHVNQGSVSSDKKVTKQNLLKEVNSSISSLNNSLTNSLTITPVSMNAGPNFTIDVNNSYRMGNLIIVYVKGHLSGSGSTLFTLSGVSGTVRNGSNTFAVGTGDAWSISGSGYCYFNETRKDFSTTLSSGYLHIHYVILIS